MGAATEYDLDPGAEFDGQDLGPGTALTLAPDSVVVRRNTVLLGAVGVLALVVSAAYVTRALATAAPLDWAIAGVLGLLALFHLGGAWDSRTPLLVADTQGIRLRLGRSWRGLTWGAIERVEHLPSPGALRDGRLYVVAHNEERALEGVESSGQRAAGLTRRFYGSALAVPLGISTRTTHDGDDLTEALHALAGGRVPVVTVIDADLPAEDDVEVHDALADEETGPEEYPTSGPRLSRLVPGPTLARLISRVATFRGSVHHDPAPDAEHEAPAEAEGSSLEVPRVVDPVVPLREPHLARRSEVTVGLPPEREDVTFSSPSGVVDAGAGELRRDGSVPLVEEREGWGSRVRAIAEPGHPVEPLVLEEDVPEPAADPIIGPRLAAARTRLGLSVDDLAARTRIRAHVIEAVEVDDFSACGGDFYARGHLRTLGRVLSVDSAPLLEVYDDRYAHAPVNPRKVFEAELAGGGSWRSTRGGPNWSVLVAAVMALVLAWSVARLMMDSPVDLRPAPSLNGSAGVRAGNTASGDKVPVLLRAAGGGAHVVVRDGSGKVIFTGDIAYGQTKSVSVTAPVQVETSDGSVEVVVNGTEKGAVGDIGQRATATYVVR